VEQLAHHASRGEVWDEAAQYLRQAGVKVYLRAGNREAAACFELALDALRRFAEHPGSAAPDNLLAGPCPGSRYDMVLGFNRPSGTGPFTAFTQCRRCCWPATPVS
jgi:hypothetical protein